MSQISAILGNGQMLDGGAMFGNAPRPMWERWEKPDEVGRIPLACRSLLIESDGKRILCEAGIGNFFEPMLAQRFGVQTPDRHLLSEGLTAMGVDEASIDYVILSHLHFDHAGGILPSYQEIQSGNQGLRFPNATFLVGKEAFERACHPHPRDKASFIGDLPQKLAKTGRLQIVEGETADGVFEDRLSFFVSNGHTPGQMHTIFQGEKQKVFFAGDLIPGRNWVHLPITMGYDRYPEKLIDEKSEVYRRAVAEKWLVFFTHDPKCAFSEIEKDDRGRFRPVHPVEAPRRHPF